MSIRGSDLIRRGAERPALMGILNVTPDSFSDGGRWSDTESARHHFEELVAQGADIIDIGGESTRPGADPVPEAEELRRIIPVLDAVAGHGMPVSVDTMKASVARAAVEHGADIINDVSGLADPDMARTVAELDVPLVVMSSYGTPGTFAGSHIPGDAVGYAKGFLERAIGKALDAGVSECNIIADPGVGFGTDPGQAMEMVMHSSEFSFGKYPVLIGPSRKRFVVRMYPQMDVDDATAEVCVLAAGSGADILRVHDVSRVASRL